MRERLQPFYRSVPSSALGTILTLGNETGTDPPTPTRSTRPELATVSERSRRPKHYKDDERLESAGAASRMAD